MTYEETYSPAFREILRIVGRGKKLQRDLTREEAREAMTLILTDSAVSQAQIGGFMVTMRVKEETSEEIIGFTQGARDVMRAFPKPDVKNLVDIGLPYNGKTRNLQTGVAATIVLAATGVPVLLHGADHVPTKDGIAPLNLLRALGYPADRPPDAVKQSIEQTNFGVLNINHLLPGWTALTPMRHHFGVRTFMNSVEKLFNPADAPHHISGFYHSAYLNRMAECLPAPNSWIVQGDEGSIELRPGKKTRVYQAQNHEMVEFMLDAAEYGFAEEVDLSMAVDVKLHAETIRSALAGETGAAFDQIALTTAALLWMIGRVNDLHEGLIIARDVLSKGQALSLLDAQQIGT